MALSLCSMGTVALYVVCRRYVVAMLCIDIFWLWILVLHTYIIYVTGFGKTDHIVTIDISRNTKLKYRSRHGSLMLHCSHARFAVSLEQSFG